MTRERGIQIKTLRGALSDLGVATPTPTATSTPAPTGSPTPTATATPTPTPRSETPARETHEPGSRGPVAPFVRLVRWLFSGFGLRL